MSRSEVEQEDLFVGYTKIESVHVINGAHATSFVAIRGGDHPKMELLVATETSGEVDSVPDGKSFVALLVDGGGVGSPVIDVQHVSGDVAGTAAATVNAIKSEAFYAKASSDIPIFEADEDVVMHPTTAGAAGSIALVVLKFKVVD